MTKISEHISYYEATFSATAVRNGLKNEPNEEQLECMKLVAEKCFEPIRNWYGKPIKVNSFFRSKELNDFVNGSDSSQHCKGQAIDMSAGSREENMKLYEWAKGNLIFDQLIYEYGDSTGPDWVHISYKTTGNRNQILRIK